MVYLNILRTMTPAELR